MTTNNRTGDQDPEHTPFQVVGPSKPDYRTQKVACVFCSSIMSWLRGMPEGHGQWLCQNCGSVAYEGYGDTPAHNTDPEHKLIVSPNDVYPTGAAGFDLGMGKPFFKDVSNDLDMEIDEEFDELKPRPGRLNIKHLSEKTSENVKRRYGMHHDIGSAEEASAMLER